MSMQLNHTYVGIVDGYQVAMYLDHDIDGFLSLNFKTYDANSDLFYEYAIRLPQGTSQESLDLWERMSICLMDEITPEKFEAGVRESGLFNLINKELVDDVDSKT